MKLSSHQVESIFRAGLLHDLVHSKIDLKTYHLLVTNDNLTESDKLDYHTMLIPLIQLCTRAKIPLPNTSQPTIDFITKSNS